MIRSAIVSDFKVLTELFIEENAFNHLLASDRIAKTSDVLTVSELRYFIEADKYFLRVFEADSKPVGLILAEFIQTTPDRWKQAQNKVYLMEIAVTEQYRRQGIGSKLIQSLIEWGNQKQADCIDLHVWKDNKTAKPLYEKLGFSEKQILMTMPLERH